MSPPVLDVTIVTLGLVQPFLSVVFFVFLSVILHWFNIFMTVSSHVIISLLNYLIFLKDILYPHVTLQFSLSLNIVPGVLCLIHIK